MTFLKNIKVIHGQSAIEVAMALALAIAIIIAGVSVWNYFATKMTVHLNDYRLSRKKALEHRDSPLFGMQPLLTPVELDIATMNVSLGEPPPAIDLGQEGSCFKPDQAGELREEFFGLKDDIEFKNADMIPLKAELIAVRVNLLQSFESWLYGYGGGGQTNINIGACGPFMQQQRAWLDCAQRHPENWGDFCGEPPSPPAGCESTGSVGINPDETIMNKSFSEIERDFNAKFADCPLCIFTPLSVQEIRGVIREGKQLEREQQQLKEQASNVLSEVEGIERPAWDAYYACLEAEWPTCMGNCRAPMNTAQNLRADAFNTFRQTYNFETFVRGEAEANAAQAAFDSCFRPCQAQQ